MDFRKFTTLGDSGRFRKNGYAVVGTSYTPLAFGGNLWVPTTPERVRVKAGGDAADTKLGVGATEAVLIGAAR